MSYTTWKGKDIVREGNVREGNVRRGMSGGICPRENVGLRYHRIRRRVFRCVSVVYSWLTSSHTRWSNLGGHCRRQVRRWATTRNSRTADSGSEACRARPHTSLRDDTSTSNTDRAPATSSSSSSSSSLSSLSIYRHLYIHAESEISDAVAFNGITQTVWTRILLMHRAWTVSKVDWTKLGPQGSVSSQTSPVNLRLCLDFKTN